jgi:hypothetical protein
MNVLQEWLSGEYRTAPGVSMTHPHHLLDR